MITRPFLPSGVPTSRVLPLLLAALLAPLPAAAGPAATTLAGPGLADGESLRVVRLEHLRVGDAMTVLRSMLAIRHLAALEPSGTLVLRDTTERLDLALDLLAEVDRPAPAVALDLRILALGPDAGDPPGLLSGSALDRLLGADGVRSLDRHLLGATADGPVRLRLGERIPVRIGGDPPVVYQDVGLDLEVDLQVHRESGRVGLDLRLLTSRAAASEFLPTVETAELQSKIRLAAGESVLLRAPALDGARWGADPEDELALVVTPRLTNPAG